MDLGDLHGSGTTFFSLKALINGIFWVSYLHDFPLQIAALGDLGEFLEA